MKDKHTPGPWGPVKEMDEEFFMRTNHKYAIQGGMTGVVAKAEGLGEEYKANAHLIAAAPELLEALQYYFDVLEEVRGKDWDEKPDHVLSKMINAVKKAKGLNA